MILQLDPPIPVVTPRGKGLCHFVIDYGPEAQIFLTVFLDESREIWTYASRECRARENITMGRPPVNDVLRDAPGTAPDEWLKNLAELQIPEPRPVTVPCNFSAPILMTDVERFWYSQIECDKTWSFDISTDPETGADIWRVLKPSGEILGGASTAVMAMKEAVLRVRYGKKYQPYSADPGYMPVDMQKMAAERYKPRPVDLENDFPPQNPFKAMEDGVDNPQTAEDWMRQAEWVSTWKVTRGSDVCGDEFQIRTSNSIVCSGNSLATACRQAVLWKRNRPDDNEVARTNEETYQELPGEDKSVAVPLADYAADVANMPEEVRPDMHVDGPTPDEDQIW